MSETPNTALRDAELAEEIRALRELASVEPQRYGAFRHHTAHVLARTLARLEQIAAPPSPDPSLDVMLLNEAAAVLERDRRVGVTPSTVASCGEMIAAIRRAVGRLNDADSAEERAALHILSGMRSLTPDEERQFQACVAKHYTEEPVSRGDVTGTPAPGTRMSETPNNLPCINCGRSEAQHNTAVNHCAVYWGGGEPCESWQWRNAARLSELRARLDMLTDALERALNAAWIDYTADTGCYPECLSVTKTRRDVFVEANFRRGVFAKYAAGFLLAAHPTIAQAFASPSNVSRPDLTGETPPASAEREFTGWFGVHYPSGVLIYAHPNLTAVHPLASVAYAHIALPITAEDLDFVAAHIPDAWGRPTTRTQFDAERERLAAIVSALRSHFFPTATLTTTVAPSTPQDEGSSHGEHHG